ncbi:hypothetical protein [Tsukamurella pulmonis]|uniref:hypothetical protein n=1 Tax=Tsukamurella pulmonis TaxID=47312 RepID=UPI000E08E5AC|nr:hypothetical protein [Tsukamurella pulmonis]RDH10464.1 hypothetical protein DVB88_17790 [Tsukamurella pulmonis]
MRYLTTISVGFPLGRGQSIQRGRRIRREPVAASYRVSQAEIERLREMYAGLHRDFTDLAQRLDHLEAELTAEKRLRWDAIGYIRVLIDALRRHAPDVPIPVPPERLRDLV